MSTVCGYQKLLQLRSHMFAKHTVTNVKRNIKISAYFVRILVKNCNNPFRSLGKSCQSRTLDSYNDYFCRAVLPENNVNEQRHVTSIISNNNKLNESSFSYIKCVYDALFPKINPQVILGRGYASDGSGLGGDGAGDRNNNRGQRQHLKLMDFKKLIWPNILKTLKNQLFVILIRGYFDNEFSLQGFLKGAEQAVVYVSNVIANGKFDDLIDLVNNDAVDEIRNNYSNLSYEQRNLINVDKDDIYMRHVHEIGMLFDDDNGKRFVEITVVLQGLHGFKDTVRDAKSFFPPSELQKKTTESMFVCNYRFIREYTKGVDSDWTINKLNHFLPVEVMEGQF